MKWKEVKSNIHCCRNVSKGFVCDWIEEEKLLINLIYALLNGNVMDFSHFLQRIVVFPLRL